MTKRSLLLVDGDAKSLRVLEVSLKKAGFSVTAAESGPAALASLRNFVPDLVISDTEMPEMDGYAFCREFKSNPEWASIPFIFLTGQTEISDKIRGLELGVDDYLTKPIYIKEILTRVRILLQKHDRSNFEQKKESNTRFAGRLNDMGVVDLIQTIEVSRKTGVIHFRADEKRQATMFFKEGKVIDAEAGHLQGEDAVYRLLTWNEGEFEALFRPVRRRAVIDIPSQSLLMEGMRRLDEWGRLQEQLPPLTQKFEVVYDELWDRLAELPDDINHILRLFDTRRTLQEVIDGSNIGDLEAVEVISKLYFEGIIVETDPSTGLKSGSYPVEDLRLHRATPPVEDPPQEPVDIVDALAHGPGESPEEDTEQGMDLAPYSSTEHEARVVFDAMVPTAPSENAAEPADSTEPTEPSVAPDLPDASEFDEPLSGLLEQAITEATPMTPGASARTTARGLGVAQVARVALKKRPATEDEASARRSQDFSKPKTKPFAVLTSKKTMDEAAAEAEETTNKLAPALTVKSSDGGLNAKASGVAVSKESPEDALIRRVTAKIERAESESTQEYEAVDDDLGADEVADELAADESQEVTLPVQAKVSEELTSPTEPKVSAEVYEGDEDEDAKASPVRWYALAAVAAGLLAIVVVKTAGDNKKPKPVPEVAITTDGSMAGTPILPAVVPDARSAVVAKGPVDAGTAVAATIPDARVVAAAPPDARRSPPPIQVEVLTSEEQIKQLQVAARKAKRSGDRLTAIELLDEALTIRRSSTSLSLKSEILLDLGDSRAAAAVAEEVTRTAPRRAQGWRLLGLARYENKDYPGARSAFARYLELAPSAKDAEDVRTLLESL